MEDYAWLTGPTPIPPLWSLGYQQSRYSYYPEARVREIADRLRADSIPADAIYLDIDYQQKNRPFTVNPGEISRLSNKWSRICQRAVSCCRDHRSAYRKAARPEYVPYDSGTDGRPFCEESRRVDVCRAKVWPGDSVFPDFTRQKTRALVGHALQGFCEDGVAGFWNDMNEPAIFDVPSKTMPRRCQHRIEEPGFIDAHGHASGNSQRLRHGKLARAPTMACGSCDPNERPFVLTRATYAGGQRFATHLDRRQFVHVESSAPGHADAAESWLERDLVVGADVGGFDGSPQPDLLTRWIEVGAFKPIDRDHTALGSNAQEPWVNGPEQEAIRRHYIEERYKLMPYLYTTAEEMSRTGSADCSTAFPRISRRGRDHIQLILIRPRNFCLAPTFWLRLLPIRMN